MTQIATLPAIAQTRSITTAAGGSKLPAVIQTASKAGGYGKLAAALVGLGVLGVATYLACKKSGGEEKAN